ncbi:MAG: hypothetical protein SPJ29_00760 [Phocaeicola sp.]|nr:hypothetical protein [Phocaeicola sp.]MDD7448886.1 hypothetical protein [Prevotellaceae bacterium]MDY3913524.1 hypothetical protein [Phocaeicola sp.]MDY5938281.1 hypothetical protein [Phocaeicola sp.]
MKKIVWFFIGVVLCVNTLSAQQVKILEGIESKIDSCFIASFKNPQAYQDTEKALLSMYNTEKSENMKSHYQYWISYLYYKKSISVFKGGDWEISKKYVEEAISYLEKNHEKTSEYYSLLAYEQIFYFQFVKRQDMFVFLDKLNNSLKMAIELDRSNPRAYYVNGYYDYYTPKEYGGKKKTELFLLKAISMRNSQKPFSPTWGIVDAYSTLIQYYVETGRKVKAKEMYQKALELYPGALDIIRLKNKL